MKKHITLIALAICMIITLCSPVFAGNEPTDFDTTGIGSQETLPCGHIRTERFLDSDECVQCFEENIIEEYENKITPYGSICSNCGGSYASIVCARSNIIDYDNYQEGESYLCTGCANGTCNSPCYVLQYLSYSKYKCNACQYEEYVFNSSGTGLARHYCGVYDYCSGQNYYRYCDLHGEDYENPWQ